MHRVNYSTLDVLVGEIFFLNPPSSEPEAHSDSGSYL